MILTLLFSLLAVGVGIVLLMWGYRAFLVMLPIFGFFAGFWIGAHAISAIFGTGFLADVTGLVVGLVAGVVVAVLSYLFYFVGVALVAAALGYGLGAGFMQAIGLEAWWIIIPAGIVAALAVLALAFLFNLQKYVVMALTAIAGANALVLGALTLFGRVSVDEVAGAGNAIQPVLQESWFWGLAWLALAIIGVIYQVRTNRTYVYTVEEYWADWGQPG